jgi:hypothetical protein
LLRHRIRRPIGVLVVLGAALAIATTAEASYEQHYCENDNLYAQWGCAGGAAHTGGANVHITTDHTGCAAIAWGYGGLEGPPYAAADTGVANCTTGAGTVGAHVTLSASDPGHGAVWNPNGSTTDYITSGYIDG